MHGSESTNTTTNADRALDTEGIEAALDEARRTALREHALAGRKVPVWCNGRVVWVTPTLEGEISSDGPDIPSN